MMDSKRRGQYYRQQRAPHAGSHGGLFVFLIAMFGIFWLVYRLMSVSGLGKKDLYTFKYDYK